jgi:hypothetical protein
MNPREAEILEQARDRKIRIQNLQRDNLEAAAIWRDKQQKSYGNMVSITEAVPLSKIITDEQQAQSQDEFLQRQHATANIGTLADQANTEYIVDRLNYEQMRWMNDNWEGIIRNIQKKSTRMDKDVFVNMIIQESASAIPYTDSFAGAPTQAMAQRAALQAGASEALAQRMAAQAQGEVDQAAQQAQAGIDLNTDRARGKAGNKLKKFIISKRPSLPVTSALPPQTPPRAVSPTMSAAAQAGINASMLSAQLQAIADKKLKNSAGGNATTPGVLTTVYTTVGNAVTAGGAPASPPSSPRATPKTSPITTMVISPQPSLPRLKGVDIDPEQIESVLGINWMSQAEEDDPEFNKKLAPIMNEIESLSSGQVKNRVIKILTIPKYTEITDKLKQVSGLKKIKERTWKDMLFLLKIDKLRQLPTAGTGLRRKRVIRGKGYTKNTHPRIQPRRHYINEAYYIDMNKLDDNILCVKYAQNDSVLPHLKPQSISSKTKEMITDILGDKYDDRIFRMLAPEEKRDVKKFCKCVKLDIRINDPDEAEYQRQFEIVRGEYMSGNDSPEIKATLKRYILEALRDNKIAKSDGYNLLYSLSL